MRMAIFSDVHGNWDALHVVLEKIAELNVDAILCLGDVVGYGADPNPCVAAVHQVAYEVLAGNHDWAAVGLSDTRFFNPLALAAIQWTAEELDDAHAAFLRDCPLTLDDGDVRYAHAHPVRPDCWEYVSSPDWGRIALLQTDYRVCFVGHSHRAFICSENASDDVLIEGEITLVERQRYLINVGSVGQPRDGDPRAAFAVLDRETGNLCLHRVSYDVAAAQAKICAAGLPEFLAERIAFGR